MTTALRSIRFPADLLAELCAEADRQGASVNGLAVRMIRGALASPTPSASRSQVPAMNPQAGGRVALRPPALAQTKLPPRPALKPRSIRGYDADGKALYR